MYDNLTFKTIVLGPQGSTHFLSQDQANLQSYFATWKANFQKNIQLRLECNLQVKALK